MGVNNLDAALHIFLEIPLCDPLFLGPNGFSRAATPGCSVAGPAVPPPPGHCPSTGIGYYFWPLQIQKPNARSFVSLPDSDPVCNDADVQLQLENQAFVRRITLPAGCVCGCPVTPGPCAPIDCSFQCFEHGAVSALAGTIADDAAHSGSGNHHLHNNNDNNDNKRRLYPNKA